MTRQLTTAAHAFVAPAIAPGDCVLDATAGNGFDTVFLAKQVGTQGRVLAIDIQQAALDATAARLRQDNLLSRVTLLAGSHARIGTLIPQPAPLSAAMFNLGYLPGSDKRITTQPSSTLTAIAFALKHLQANGRLSILAYRGHAGGEQEASAVAAHLLDLSPVAFSVTQKKAPASGPVLWRINKKRVHDQAASA